MVTANAGIEDWLVQTGFSSIKGTTTTTTTTPTATTP